MTRLTWDDLLIQDSDADLLATCLQPWKTLLPALRHRVICLNRLGDWFLQSEDLRCARISVLYGTYEFIADHDEGFRRLMNDEAWQVENLWSLKVLAWRQLGLKAGPGQVYAPTPHPRFLDGRIAEQVTVMDLWPWQHIAAQMLGLVV